MKEKIAIIGSGISGLSAAYLLSEKYDVHLYEKNNRLGGHTRTLYVNELSKKIPIDTGFIVFNEENYPDLSNFFKLLKIDCRDSDMSFSVSNNIPNIDYSGNNTFTLLYTNECPVTLVTHFSKIHLKGTFVYYHYEYNYYLDLD